MKFTKFNLLFLLLMYMSIIFVLSHIPSGTDNQFDYIKFAWLTPNVSNLLHIPLFGGLAYLWIKYFQCQMYSGKSLIVSVVLVCGVYAFTDELHQYFIPGRFASFSDWVLDLIGVVLALKFYPVIDWMLRAQVTQQAVATTK